MAALPSKVWPNPAHEVVHVALAGAQAFQFRISDLMGRRVLSGTSSSEVEQINIQGLSSGTYMVEIEHQGSRALHRLVIP
jgi:hypothetical protein